MFGPIKAVAIDDEPSHLLSITTGLSSVGIPCLGYWFDRDENELRPAPPEGGLPHLRLILCDLNLAELGGVPDTQSLWSVVVNVLKQVVSKEAGPYLLVFWTGVEKRAADVKEMLYARADHLEGMPCPIEVLELPKAEFLVQPTEGKPFNEGLKEFYAALHASIDGLRTAVAGAVATNANLNAVAAWESRAADAAAHTVNEVHRCARSDEPDPLRANGSFAKVIAKIAAAASGSAAARAEPARSLDAGMLDILVDQFGSSVDTPQYKAKVSAAINEALAAEIDFADKVATFAELNTFFHVDRQVGTARPSDRGVVVAARPLAQGNNILGFRPGDFLTSDFLFPPELFPPDEREKVSEHIRQIRDATSFVLVELGADCDHAQDHGRTRRFLLGVELAQDHLYLAHHLETGELRSGALELLGPWKIDGSVRYLLVSCRRFWAWQGQSQLNSAPRFRLRAPLVDKLLHRYASWSSRPGIVEFR